MAQQPKGQRLPADQLRVAAVGVLWMVQSRGVLVGKWLSKMSDAFRKFWDEGNNEAFADEVSKRLDSVGYSFFADPEGGLFVARGVKQKATLLKEWPDC
jgi:hypothetical protein